MFNYAAKDQRLAVNSRRTALGAYLCHYITGMPRAASPNCKFTLRAVDMRPRKWYNLQVKQKRPLLTRRLSCPAGL